MTRKKKRENLESVLRGVLDDASEDVKTDKPKSHSTLKQVIIVGQNQVIFTGDMSACSDD